MMKLIRVEDDTSLARDPETGAILMTNSLQHKNYVEKRALQVERSKEIERHTKEINNIKDDLCEIKSMLVALLNGKQ
jgi:hypothetical protein